MNRYKIIFLLFLGFSATLSAQEEENIGTEVVNVVKPYTPSISNAFKVKATPVLNDSITTVKKKVTYSIFSVPVASTFTPAKGKAANLKRVKPQKLYDNYATLGFGNFTSLLAEFYSNYQISRTQDFGIFLNHNSSQGGIEGVNQDDFFYDTRFNANYSVRERDMAWGIDGDVRHQVFNWYGADPLTFGGVNPGDPFLEQLNDLDVTHSFLGLGVQGNISFEDAIFSGARASIKSFTDSEGSSEIRGVLKPVLDIPIAGENIRTEIVLDFLNGSFEENAAAGIPNPSYGFFNAGLAPSLQILRDDLTLNLGVRAYVSMDTQASETTFKAYPNINASYLLSGDQAIVYGGLEGDLVQNSYEQLAQENPFVSPGLVITPTDQQYQGFLGLKGRLSNSFSYNLRGSLTTENDKLLFKANTFNPSLINRPAFAFANSFTTVVDDVTTVSIFGEINIDVSSRFKLKGNVQFNTYETDNEAEAWNLPQLEANLFMDYQITEKLFAGASLFFVGERQEQLNIINGLTGIETQTATLDSFVDLNFHLGYRINDRLTAFGRVNNILGENYLKWFNYPVQGLQALGGVTYKFDF